MTLNTTLSAFVFAAATLAVATTIPSDGAFAKNGHTGTSNATSSTYTSSVGSDTVHGPGSSHHPTIVCNSSKCPNQPPPR